MKSSVERLEQLVEELRRKAEFENACQPRSSDDNQREKRKLNWRLYRERQRALPEYVLKELKKKKALAEHNRYFAKKEKKIHEMSVFKKREQHQREELQRQLEQRFELQRQQRQQNRQQQREQQQQRQQQVFVPFPAYSANTNAKLPAFGVPSRPVLHQAEGRSWSWMRDSSDDERKSAALRQLTEEFLRRKAEEFVRRNAPQQ